MQHIIFLKIRTLDNALLFVYNLFLRHVKADLYVDRTKDQFSATKTNLPLNKKKITNIADWNLKGTIKDKVPPIVNQ